MIGIPSGIGQAKHVYTLLSDWCKEAEMSSEEALRTAVILPDEHLLIPVLNAIPEQIRRINVTMGYPLAGTPVASLIEYILALQKNVRYIDPVSYTHLGRYRDVVDEYYNYMNEYPEGNYVKQVTKFYDYASKRITDAY